MDFVNPTISLREMLRSVFYVLEVEFKSNSILKTDL